MVDGGRRGFNGRLIPIVCLFFQLLFFMLVKSVFQPLSFDCIKFSLKQPFLDQPIFRINVSSASIVLFQNSFVFSLTFLITLLD